jgi:hypothetical protein
MSSAPPDQIWAFYSPDIQTDEPHCTIVASENVQHGGAPYIRKDLSDAKDAEIAELRAKVERLSRALDLYADQANWGEVMEAGTDWMAWSGVHIDEPWMIARAALQGDTDGQG